MAWRSLPKSLPSSIRSLLSKSTLVDISVLTLIVLVSNILLITGTVNNNPLNVRSGLQSDGQIGVLTGQNTTDPNDGYTTQALGKGAAEQLFHGHLPWWNHYEQVGAPLAGEMQSAAFFPVSWLLLLPGGFLLFRIALQLIAGIGTYLLLKRLGCSRKVSLLGGVCFSLNGTFAWLVNAASNPVAFLPWLVLGIEKAFSAAKDRKRGGFIMIVVAIALSLYAGFPETAFINIMFAGVWALVRLWQAREQRIRLIFIKKLIGAGTLGLMISAPILVAFLAYLPHAEVGIHEANGSTGGLLSMGLPALLLPYIYGPIAAYSNNDTTGQLAVFWGGVGGFSSLLVAFFALTGLASKKHRALAVLSIAWVIVAVAKMFDCPIISDIINAIPGITRIAFYRYSPPAIEFALVVAMALGLDHLYKASSKARRRTISYALVGVVVLLVPLLLIAHKEISHINGLHYKYWVLMSLAWGLGAIVLCAIWISKVRYKMAYVVSGLILLESLVFFVTPQLSTQRHVKIDMAPVQFLQQHNDGHRFFTLGPLQANYGTYWKVASINTNNLPISKDWSDYVTHNLNQNVSPIVFTGFSQSDPAGPNSQQEFLKHINSYEYVGVKYVLTGNNPETMQQLQAAGLIHVFTSKTTMIFELPNPADYFTARNGACQTSYVSRDSLDVNCSSSGEVLRRELYMPGWVARDQNGNRLAISKVGPLFQSVKVQKETKIVEFSFSPPHIIVAYISLVSALLILIAHELLIRSSYLENKLK